MKSNYYYIEIECYTEPKCKGNLTQFYYISCRGNKITLGGRMSKKIFLNQANAIKTANKVFNLYNNGEFLDMVRIIVKDDQLNDILILS